MYTFLSGGTGTPKLIEGARIVLDDSEISVVVNTGEDIWYQGGHISPDVDTVLYLFAGILNTGTFWGIEGDTFVTNEMINFLGSNIESYMGIGDKDRAVQLARGRMLEEMSLTEVTSFLAERFGVMAKVFPMSDSPYTTMIKTESGEIIHFQEYWVKYRGSVPIAKVLREPEIAPTTTKDVLSAIAGSDLVIIGPSNPVTSILPILECIGIREALKDRFVVSVSPFIGNSPVSGPAGALMEAMGLPSNSFGLSMLYGEFVDLYVQDVRDDVKIEGREVIIVDTLMKTPDIAASLMKEIIKVAGNL